MSGYMPGTQKGMLALFGSNRVGASGFPPKEKAFRDPLRIACHEVINPVLLLTA